MDLLRFAGRRLRDARVLLIVTFRDDDLATDDQLRVALGELARHRTTRRISPGPAVRGRGAGAGRRQRPGGRRAVPADRRKPVLRDRGPAGRDGARCRPRPGTPCWPGRPAGRRRQAAARGRRADRRPGRGGAARGGAGCPRRPSTSCWRAGCSPPTADGCGSGTRSPGWRWSRPSRRAAARRSTARSSPPCARPGRRTRRRWPFTPRKRTTSRRCCGTRPPRRAGRPRWRSHREAVAQFERALRFAAGHQGRHGRGPVRRAGRRADAARPGGGSGRGLQARAGAMARGRRPAARRRYHPPAVLLAVAPVPRRGMPMPPPRPRWPCWNRWGPGPSWPGRYAELASRSMVLGRHEAAIENARRAQVHRRARGRARR